MKETQFKDKLDELISADYYIIKEHKRGKEYDIEIVGDFAVRLTLPTDGELYYRINDWIKKKFKDSIIPNAYFDLSYSLSIEMFFQHYKWWNSYNSNSYLMNSSWHIIALQYNWPEYWWDEIKTTCSPRDSRVVLNKNWSIEGSFNKTQLPSLISLIKPLWK